MVIHIKQHVTHQSTHFEKAPIGLYPSGFRLQELQRTEYHRQHQQERRHRGKHDPAPVSSDKLVHTIAPAVRAGSDRQILLMPLQVFEQRRHIRVPRLRCWRHRPADDGIQIASQQSTFHSPGVRRGTFGRGTFRHSTFRHCTWQRPRRVDERRLFSGRRTPLGTCQAIGQGATEQFVEDRTQTVDITGDGRRHACTSLGRGIGARVTGSTALAAAVGVDQAGNTKIKQPNLSVFINHDVGGLQIGVHNQLTMGVLHGLADTHEEGQALRQRQIKGADMFVQRQPLAILHHQIGSTFMITTVEDADDGGMLQSRQDLSFLEKPLTGAGGMQRRLHQLDGNHLIVEPVIARRLVDHAHAAPANDVDHPEIADPCRHAILWTCVIRSAEADLRKQCIGLCGTGEQQADALQQPRVPSTQVRQELSCQCGRLINQLLEQRQRLLLKGNGLRCLTHECCLSPATLRAGLPKYAA